ncbi:MAG: ParB/RepB/Spo0J family partition protein [Pseudomonadota bacterium]|nr:ParB/RepB/Spo0J family partition protein [Pseudomonadota bacterium]
MTVQEKQKRPGGLGRGLSALFGDVAAMTGGPGEERQILPLDLLEPGRYQPRRQFDSDALAQLTASIREQGVLLPLLVRRTPGADGKYEIIAGERRWRAARKAGLTEVPVIVRDMDDRTALEAALVENLQRQDLNPLEEGEGYQRLMTEFGHTQEALAKALGKSRSHIANMVRLLGLPEPVKSLVQTGDLSAGHARALVPADDPVGLARDIVRRNLNVRQTEDLVRQAAEGPAKTPKKQPLRPAAMAELEKSLGQYLGLRVSIHATEEGGGSVVLHYRTMKDFDALMARLVPRNRKSPE